MQYFQDSLNGEVYAFEDGVDITGLRQLPPSLMRGVSPKPGTTWVWYSGAWCRPAETPAGYVAPVWCPTVVNPAWTARLVPFTLLTEQVHDFIDFNLESSNANSYNGFDFGRPVLALPIDKGALPVLVTVDGTLMLPQAHQWKTEAAAIRTLNEVLCCLLLGGFDVQPVTSQTIGVGVLQGLCLFEFECSSHMRLRHNQASLSERMSVFRRSTTVEYVEKCFYLGRAVQEAIPAMPFTFLLNGRSAERSGAYGEALISLWICLEQLAAFALSKAVAEKNAKRHRLLMKIAHENRIRIKKGEAAAILNMLRLFGVTDRNWHIRMIAVRKARNELMHSGKQPVSSVVETLWAGLIDLMERVSKIDGLSDNIQRKNEFRRSAPSSAIFPNWSVVKR